MPTISGERIAAREAPVMRELAKRAVEDHFAKRRPSTRYDVYGDRVDDKGYPAGGQMAKWIIPILGRVKVADIKAAHVEELHAKVTKAGPPIRANRVVATLSKIMVLAIRWGYRSENTNPCKGAVERNPETKRKRYLSPAELARLSKALAAHSNQQATDLIRLLTLTGARRGETMAAKISIWNPASGKNRAVRPNKRPSIICRCPGRRLNSWNGTGSVSDIKKSWAAVCRAAGIENARLHDLRHTVASVLVSSGASLPLVGAILGHSNPTTTARYSHLYADPVRSAADRLGVVVTGGKGAEMVLLRPRRGGGDAHYAHARSADRTGDSQIHRCRECHWRSAARQ